MVPSKLSVKMTFASSAWGFEEVDAEIGKESANFSKSVIFELSLLDCHQYLVYVVGGVRHDEA